MIAIRNRTVAYMGTQDLNWSAPFGTFFGSKLDFIPAELPDMIVLVSERTRKMKAFVIDTSLHDETLYRELDGKLKIAIRMED